jgi:hypothetical protein
MTTVHFGHRLLLDRARAPAWPVRVLSDDVTTSAAARGGRKSGLGRGAR